MADAINLKTDDGTTISLLDFSKQAVLADGHKLDDPDDGRTLTLQCWAGTTSSTPLTIDQLETNFNAIRRVLLKAAVDRSEGATRTVTLETQANGASYTTIFDVLGGRLIIAPIWRDDYLATHTTDFAIELEIEPYTRSSEASILSGSVLRSVPSITHRYVATGASNTSTDGTAQGNNMAMQVSGQLLQKTRQTDSGGVTYVTAANQVALYFGNTNAQFDRLVMGLQVAGSGTWTGVWEYYNGSAWTTLTTTANPFKTTRDWDTAAALDAITWTIPGDWATKSFNSITAYWVRWRISSFTSMSTVPVLMNGPVRSHVGLGVITSSQVNGDVPAPALVHLQHTGGLADGFNDTSRDSSKWAAATGTIFTTNASVTVAEANGVLTLTPLASTAGTNGNGYRSASTYDATDRTLSLEIVLAPTATTTTTLLGLSYWLNSSNYLAWLVNANSIIARKVTAGVTTDTTITYARAAHRYLRIRHNAAADTVFWEYSADGITWTSGRSVARDFAITAVNIAVEVGTTGSDGSAGPAQVDNLAFGGLAGVRAGIATGKYTSHCPPHIVSLLNAELSQPSVTTTLLAETDTKAAWGERLRLRLNASYTDGAFHLDGSDDYITRAMTASNKLDISGDLVAECIYTPDGTGTAPMLLVGKWDRSSSSSTTGFWALMVDNNKLRAVAVTSTNTTKVKSVYGKTALNAGQSYRCRLEFKASAQRLYLYLDGQQEGSQGMRASALNSGGTTAMRVGSFVNWYSGDSLDGSSAAVALDGTIDEVIIRTDPVAASTYTLPTAPYTDSSSVRWLLHCDDTSGTTVTDSATIAGAALNGTYTNGTISGSVPVAGYYNSGTGGLVKAIGFNFPACYAEEWRGTYHVYLAVTLAAAITTPLQTNSPKFQLQLNVGDSTLPMATRSLQRFVGTDPQAAPGYTLIDLGVMSFPPAQIKKSTGSAPNVVQGTLFVEHAYQTQADIYLDCLYLVPAAGCLEYDTFRFGVADATFNPAFDVRQGEGVKFDARGADFLVGQTTDDSTNGTQDSKRNPYARPAANEPLLYPQKPAWLIGLPLKATVPSTSGDPSLVRVVGDTLTATVKAVPQWQQMAAA